MSFYVSNALGFFIQLAPCALMFFMAFPEESLRVRRRNLLAWTAALAAAIAAIFPLVAVGPGYTMRGNLIMLLAAVMALVAAECIVRVPVMKKFLAYIVILFYAAAQFWLVNAVMEFLPNEIAVQRPYLPATTALYAVAAALTLPVMLRHVIRPLRDFLREMEPGEMHRELAATVISTAAFVAEMMYVYNYVSVPIDILLELLLLMGQLMFYWLLFQGSMRRKRDSERRRALEIQQLQYDKISREMENTRRLRHDLRHHLNTLGALNAQGKREEIAAYLREYGAVVDRLDDMKFSGDPVADGVLAYYLAQAEDLSAKVECQALLEGVSGVEATDMTVLLGNILENALSALARLPEDRRQLSVELRSARDTILLRIRNTCAERDDTGEPAGWRAFAVGGGRQGVGLSSVSAIAEKYNGSALFQRRDGVFTTRVILDPHKGEN